jgi:hypothetical protein
MDAERHYEREVRFARQDLRDGGLLASVKGHRQVTDVRRILSLTPDAVQEMIRHNRRNRRDSRAVPPQKKPSGADQLASRPPTATTGPRPTEWVSEARRANGPADTYALRFGNTDLWKVGFASDVRSRVAAINRHIPVELIDDRWELVGACHWPSQLAAYAMEQEVLTILAAERTIFERVRCSHDRLTSAWEQARVVIAKQQPAHWSVTSGGSNVSTRGRPKA